MSRSLVEMPAVHFTGNDLVTGQFPLLQARAALENRPIFRWPIREAWGATQDYVFMVPLDRNHP